MVKGKLKRIRQFGKKSVFKRKEQESNDYYTVVGNSTWHRGFLQRATCFLGFSFDEI